ncbi:MAG: hypothetical protein WCH43_15735, partial [Verrucomicrobiota bacterium]
LNAGAAGLSKEDLAKSVKLDALTIPTAGELFTALNKVAKPNWQQQYRKPIPTAFTSRPQIALNLGGLIADGYIAVQAEDSQQVKNIGKDIVALAKTLGVSENVLRRGKCISDFAENNEWNALKEELEATQNEVKQAMEEQHDEELITLVTLGGWIRGTEVVSAWISENYQPAAAKLLRQPAIVAFLQNKLQALPDKAKSDPLVLDVASKLDGIEKLLSFPSDKTPTLEEVKALNAATAELVKEISTKQ